jgi:hypothetical protein
MRAHNRDFSHMKPHIFKACTASEKIIETSILETTKPNLARTEPRGRFPSLTAYLYPRLLPLPKAAYDISVRITVLIHRVYLPGL